MEVGLWDMLKDRWLQRKYKGNKNNKTTEVIELDQVALIIIMMCCGIIIAFIILIIEKIVYAYKLKLS